MRAKVRATISGRGVTWGMHACLEDLDHFADIFLLSLSFTDMTAKLKSVVHAAAAAGLSVNVRKTWSLRINSDTPRLFSIQVTAIGVL